MEESPVYNVVEIVLIVLCVLSGVAALLIVENKRVYITENLSLMDILVFSFLFSLLAFLLMASFNGVYNHRQS